MSSELLVHPESQMISEGHSAFQTPELALSLVWYVDTMSLGNKMMHSYLVSLPGKKLQSISHFMHSKRFNGTRTVDYIPGLLLCYFTRGLKAAESSASIQIFSFFPGGAQEDIQAVQSQSVFHFFRSQELFTST